MPRTHYKPKRTSTLYRARRIRRRIRGRLTRVPAIHRFKRTTTIFDSTVADFNTAQTNCTQANGSGMWTVTNSGAGPSMMYASRSYAFKLADIDPNNEFTSLFDYYRIERIVVTLYPIAISSDTQNVNTAGNGGSGGDIYWTVDRDDNTAVAASESGLRDIMQYRTFKMQNLIGGRQIKLNVGKPTVVNTVAGTAGPTVGFANSKNKLWLDCATPTIDNYGLKIVLAIFNPTVGAAGTFNFNMRGTATYWISMKDPR